jgi:hypothetical protein
MPEATSQAVFGGRMKKVIQLFVAKILLGSLTLQAEPLKTWNWQEPTLYENGNTIPAGDLTNYTLHCGTQSGGPYGASQTFSTQTPPSIDDMGFVVSGTPGTYYCVSTVDSLQHSTTSGFSNEVNFSVLPADLGYVPMPPANLALQ